MTVDGLESIYTRNKQSLYTLALSIVGCESLAEDCVHQACLAIHKSSSSPSGDPEAYVFRSVRNVAIDLVRGKSRQKKLQTSVFNGYVPPSVNEIESPDNRTLTRERDQILRNTIDDLDDHVREIVLLKTYSNLTFQQIGEVLQMPGKTVATQYRRALMILARKLKGQI